MNQNSSGLFGHFVLSNDVPLSKIVSLAVSSEEMKTSPWSRPVLTVNTSVYENCV